MHTYVLDNNWINSLSASWTYIGVRRQKKLVPTENKNLDLSVYCMFVHTHVGSKYEY